GGTPGVIFYRGSKAVHGLLGPRQVTIGQITGLSFVVSLVRMALIICFGCITESVFLAGVLGLHQILFSNLAAIGLGRHRLPIFLWIAGATCHVQAQCWLQ